MKKKVKQILVGYGVLVLIAACNCKPVPTVHYNIETIMYGGNHWSPDSTQIFNMIIATIDTIRIEEAPISLNELVINQAYAMMQECPHIYYKCQTSFSSVKITSDKDILPGYESGKDLASLFTFNLGHKFGTFDEVKDGLKNLAYEDFYYCNFTARLKVENPLNANHNLKFCFVTDEADTLQFTTGSVDLRHPT